MVASSSASNPLQPWQAPLATRPLDATVTIPGSKSLTNRALILAALANSPTVLHGALRSRDALLMVRALESFGVDVRGYTGNGPLVLVPPPRLHSLTEVTRVNCGLAGTVMRFVPPLAALAEGTFLFDGDQQAYARPLSPLLAALSQLGVQLQTAGSGTLMATSGKTPETLPFTLFGTGQVAGGPVQVDASASSQFVSGLLLTAARFTNGLDLATIGPCPSAPHIAMTVEILRQRGVKVYELTAGGHPVALGVTPSRWRVEPGRINGGEYHIEPDLSNAGPFLAAALVAGGQVRVNNWPRQTNQAGDAWRWILPQMGANVRMDGQDLVVRGPGAGHIRGIVADFGQVGELVPTVAALATLANTPSQLSGVAHLRGHETDRLAALATEISKLGGQVQVTADGLHITPAPMHGAAVHAYHDHRMATFGAIIGLHVPGVSVDDIDTTSKTLPSFAKMWQEMLLANSSQAGAPRVKKPAEEGR